MSDTLPAMCQKINGQNGSRKRNSPVTPENAVAICRLRQTLTNRQIAEKLNISLEQVKYFLKENKEIVGTYDKGAVARRAMLVFVQRQTREKINPELGTKLLDIIARDDMIAAILDGE